jgi:Protein of unknown function (DUF2961)
MKKLLLGLVIPLLTYGAGSCTVGTPARIGSSPNWSITINCTGDSSTGSFPAASLSYLKTTQTQLLGYFIYRVTVKPGATAPTANYSVTITDTNGADMLANNGTGVLSATVTQSYSLPASVPLTGSENINFTGNSVASANTQITLYIGPSLSAGTASITSQSSTSSITRENRTLTSSILKNSTCAINATCTLANVSGAGTVVRLWFATNAGNLHTVNDGIYNITVDGTLVLSAPQGAVFGSYINGPATAAQNIFQPFASPRFTLTQSTTTSVAGIINWIIPFKTSLLIQYVNNAASTASTQIYSDVDYYAGAPPTGLYPPQMGVFHSNFIAFTSVAHFANLTLLPTVNASGMLGSVQLYVFNASLTTPYWLEGELSVTLDGIAYTYSGTEDFFCGSFYFGALKGNITGSCGVDYAGAFGASGYGTSMYRFFYDDSLMPFNSSINIIWPNGMNGQGGDPGTVSASALIVYYTAT